MDEQDDEQGPVDDEYLESLLRGELPEELRTVFQHLDKETFSAFLGILTFAFVGTHGEFRQRYAPTVPRDLLRHDLMQWLAFHVREAWEAYRQENPGIADDDHRLKALQQILESYLGGVEELLKNPPSPS